MDNFYGQKFSTQVADTFKEISDLAGSYLKQIDCDQEEFLLNIKKSQLQYQIYD